MAVRKRKQEAGDQDKEKEDKEEVQQEVGDQHKKQQDKEQQDKEEGRSIAIWCREQEQAAGQLNQMPFWIQDTRR
jgi:hypothetical protein